MKKRIASIIPVFILTIQLALAGTPLDSYWPMHDGDNKLYSYIGYWGESHLSLDVYSNSVGEFEMYYDSPDYSESDFYENTGAELLMKRASSRNYDMDLSFDPPVVFLNDAILQNGGSVSTSTTADLNGSYLPMTITTTVSKANTVVVPAGSFSNCRNVQVKMSVPGQGSSTIYSMVLAPDVGSIREMVGDGVWAQLLIGTVGGTDVGVLAVGAPKLTVKTPVNNQRILATNNAIKITGSATGYLPGLQVFYQFNSEPWTNATVAGTDWSANTPALPGTNTLAAYALDSVGRTSPVVMVKFVYVVTATLGVQTVGKGTLSPNYANAALVLGQAYTIKGLPASGYAFTNWTGQVNGDWAFSTNKAALTFVMQSNLVLTATYVDMQKPTFKVTAPVAKQRCSNAVFIVKGTTKDNGPMAGVIYQVNGGAWTNDAQSVNGWSNWTAAITLVPGSNTFRAYAVDMAGNRSLTNTVSFTYVLSDVLHLELTGKGTLSPNYSNSFLELGRSYSTTAKPAVGFLFTNWTGRVNGEMIFSTNKAALTFVMQSNLALTATFVDVQKPALTITYPITKQTISNALLTATCRATDNLGVTALIYQLNGADWECITTSIGGTNWTLAKLPVVAGTNVLKAFAVDATGNVSLTNVVTFNYSVPPFNGFAPGSLAGLVGEVRGSMIGSVMETPFEISFGTSTFGISTTDTNSAVAVGNYTCTQLDSNTVELATLIVAPPHEAGGLMTKILVFTNDDICVFTNDYDRSLGSITFTPATKHVPSASAILAIQHWGTDSGTNVTVFNRGMFTNYSNYATDLQMADSWGTYSLEPFSPVVAVLQMNYTNPADAGGSDYTQLAFSTTGSGEWFSISYDVSWQLDFVGTGSFQILSSTNPPAGNAPMSLAGKLISVSQGGRTFKLCFSEYTYSMFDTDTNDENTVVSDYTYMKTGPNTGKLFDHTVMPPYYSNLAQQNRVDLTFTSASSGTAQPPEGGPANFSISTANSYAPASLAGRNITSREGGNLIGSGTFNRDGTFTFTMAGGATETMKYAYTQVSPLGGMIIATHQDGMRSYIQVQFTSTTAGLWYETDYDSAGNYISVETGTFTLN